MESVVERSPTVVLADIEKRIDRLRLALSCGRRPSRAEADKLVRDVHSLPRTDGSVPSWRLVEIDRGLAELAGSAPAKASGGVPATRPPAEPKPRPRSVRDWWPDALQQEIDSLRSEVDALHDEVDSGSRLPAVAFDDLHAQLMGLRRLSRDPEIAQMIADVRVLRGVRLTASRRMPDVRPRPRFGRGSARGPAEDRSPRSTLRPVRQARRSASARAVGSAHATERSRLAEQSRWLRDRAERFAAAIPRGRSFPARESISLLRHLQALRVHVDHETGALNAAAARQLHQAVTADARRRSSRY